jgi:hypothetical protein
MSARTIRLDQLVGRVVRDENGQRVGRIHDMRAEEKNGALVVVEYHLGAHALIERVGLSLTSLIGVANRSPRKVGWERLDISDPERPILRG